MGQILHGSATTTHAIRAAIQRSKAPLKELATQHGLNRKTVAKWRKRTFVHDAPMGPKTVRSTVLTAEEEAAIVAFRKHTLLPLDDCLYALQAKVPHLTRSSLHRCFQRHGISRLPEAAGDKPAKQPFKRYPIGYFHIDIAEVRTEEGKLYLFVAVDRTSKFAFAEGDHSHRQSFPRRIGRSRPLQNPHRAHRQRHPVRRPAQEPAWPDRALARPPLRPDLLEAWHRSPSHQAQPPMDQRPSRTDEPDAEGGGTEQALKQIGSLRLALGGMLAQALRSVTALRKALAS